MDNETTETQQTEDQDVAGGLLESLTDEGQGSQSDSQDADDDNDQGSSESSADVDAIVAKIEERLGERFDAVADRRVNAILKEVRKRNPKSEAEKPVPAAVDSGVDVRAARLTFKEYLSDDVQFIGSEERKFAMDLGAALIGARARDADDEEQLGREVADEVAGQVKGLRQYYEARTLDALRRRGALKSQGGQPPKGPGSVGGQSEWAKGAALAEEMYKVKS